MKLLAFKYFCAFFVVTAIFACIYLTAQQNYRQSANDPQIQLAEDGAALFSKGAIPQWNAQNQIDVGTSISPFIVLYDASGTAVAASGVLNGKMPTPPAGVFAAVQKYGEESVTWQTPDGLRFAAVIAPSKNGYVLAARSLREVEKREAALKYSVGAPWLITIVLLLIYCLVELRVVSNKEKNNLSK